MDIVRNLRNQVEAILDQSSDEQQSVIVRMHDANPPHDGFAPAISEAVRRRALSISARELLPPRANVVGPADKAPSKRAKKALATMDRSALAQVASTVMANLDSESLRRTGLQALMPLLGSDLVQRSVVAMADRQAQTSSGATNTRTARTSAPGDANPLVTAIWASNSAAFTISRDALAKLSTEVEGVRDIYPNRRLFVPPMVAPQEMPAVVRDNHAASWGLGTIGALATWGAYGKRGEGITVAVLDTGIDPEHPDLKDRLASWAEFDEDGKPVAGSTAHDTDQHGTHCAGIICGGRKSGRWIGVAPEARIAAALCLDGENGGTDAQILAGIQWAIEQKVDVISMSLGGLTLGPDVPSTYSVAIQKALRVGIPVVSAIGNSGNQTSGSPGNDFFSFSIGATDINDRAAGFSGGRTHVIRESSFIPRDQLPLAYSKPDISAPGVSIYSSVPGGKWEAFNGTSMATPHVAGAIALLLSATAIREKVDAANLAFLIQDLLTGSVEELGEAGQDHRYGYGRLDVLRAIGFALDRGY